ncbi:hypothetical protein V8G54_011416 [Vigna mungo]|uniref:Late embryogenesis abundant protein LEA-2 subgroup domain-containing protein n=1 Tax=Vigna mungo TaxID=3915 RepID=A0AAQ3NQ04_VIGMU
MAEGDHGGIARRRRTNEIDLGFLLFLFFLYRPHHPEFSVTNLHIVKMNLTSSADSPSHLVTLFNLIVIAKNPNNHLIFFYDPFIVTVFSNFVPVGNGSITALTSDKNN